MAYESLTRVFVERLPAEARASVGDGLEPRLRALFEAAQAAWPAIEIVPDRFVAYVAERLPADATVSDALTQVRAADLALAWACVQGNSTAVAIFDTQYMGAIDAALQRLGVQAALADDLKQVLHEQLLVRRGEAPGKLATYSGRGALANWLRVSAVRAARRSLKLASRVAQDSDQHIASAVAEGTDPELHYVREKYRPELRTAIEEALAELGAEERLLFKQYFIDEMTLDEIGKLLGLNRSSISRRFAKARQDLMQAARRKLKERLNVSDSEFRSIVGLVHSHLEVSIQRFLVHDGPT